MHAHVYCIHASYAHMRYTPYKRARIAMHTIHHATWNDVTPRQKSYIHACMHKNVSLHTCITHMRCMHKQNMHTREHTYVTSRRTTRHCIIYMHTYNKRNTPRAITQHNVTHTHHCRAHTQTHTHTHTHNVNTLTLTHISQACMGRRV